MGVASATGASGGSGATDRADRSPAVVVDTSASPHARLRPLGVAATTFADGFWAPRRRTNREVTIPSQLALLEETGRLANFRRAAGTEAGPFVGRYFNDSDVYKWLEAAAWSLATDPDPELDRAVDALVATIAAAQRADGYLDTYYEGVRADDRWTNLDLHELYCAGHLFQAAAAHERATGKRALLDVTVRFADHVVDRFNAAKQRERPWADGHPEVEMALVELYRATGDRRYLEQAGVFVDARGYRRLGRPYDAHGPEYHQDHRPLRESEELVGHAVRAVYLVAGATDVALETGEGALRAALDRLWVDTAARKTYASGGLGARHEGEAFGEAYELPNARAYAETCAAIASVMWNWRLLLLTGDARHADALETALYNGVLVGVSFGGEEYFYVNPLADGGGHRRQPWFTTACCPPNVARLLASLPGYVVTVSDDDAIWLHLYAAGETRATLPGGTRVTLRQRTGYPWAGEVEIEVVPEGGDGEFALMLRVPAWCGAVAAVAVNGAAVDGVVGPGRYAEVRRRWRTGDVVRLALPMPVRRLAAHPHVVENAGRVALARGPLLYCLEGVDNPGVDVRDVRLAPDAEVTTTMRPDLLGGVVALTVEGTAGTPDAAWRGELYRPAADGVGNRGDDGRVGITAIPYFAWAHREPGPMGVWVRA